MLNSQHRNYNEFIHSYFDYLNSAYQYKIFLEDHSPVIASFIQNDWYLDHRNYWFILELRNAVIHDHALFCCIDANENVLIAIDELCEYLAADKRKFRFSRSADGESYRCTTRYIKPKKHTMQFVKNLQERKIEMESSEYSNYCILKEIIDNSFTEIMRIHNSIIFNLCQTYLDSWIESHVSLLQSLPILQNTGTSIISATNNKPIYPSDDLILLIWLVFYLCDIGFLFGEFRRYFEDLEAVDLFDKLWLLGANKYAYLLD